MFADAPGRSLYVLQVRIAVWQRRRAHGDKDHVGLWNCLCIVRGIAKIWGGERLHLRQMRFMNGRLSPAQSFQLGNIDINAGNLVAKKGQGNTRGQTDIASSDDRHFHRHM